jgi:diaminohydroxyphosphoribosylaminopyrimidine deaminase/5-amino-6-(5-phosphoribosylamino)uracil reductase
MSELSSIDASHLRRAIELAARGGLAVRPNPQVGAVIASSEQVLGEGYHQRIGGPHAEVEAIAAAENSDLTDATLYVSLEPCAHQGLTPPCTDAILRAGLRRVVVASDDPSEHANGRGLGILRDEGVEVLIADGELEERARMLNQPFRKRARHGRPWVLLKAAMSLDGKVATRNGDSKWISGESSRALAHEWRSRSDAVAVGIGTALADDPQLTARIGGSDSEDLAEHQPRRVVFDSLGRLPTDSRLVQGARQQPLTVVVSRAAPSTTRNALGAHGVDVIVATGENEPARIGSALDQLAQAGISTILLEGGPKLAGAFLDAQEIDELRLFVAPILIGGRAARDLVESEGAESVSDALRALTLEHEQVGDDLLLSARLNVW